MAESTIIMTLIQTVKLSEWFPVLNRLTVIKPSLSLTVTLGGLNSMVTIIGAVSEQTQNIIKLSNNACKNTLIEHCSVFD